MIHILLPAYNEEDALRPLAAKIARTMGEIGAEYQIVVVNDGSTDRTAEILEELSARYPIHVITHKYNRGLGETARDGFEYLAEVAARDDVIVRMDCDDTHEPSYIPAMLAKIREGYEVVIASRYAPGGAQMGLNLYRRAISRIANLLFKVAFPIPGVWEYSCGFRAYRAALVQDALAIFGNKFIDLKGLGFTGTLEKLIKFHMMGARVAEIPFVLRYDQKVSMSKVVTSITTLGCFILIVKHSRYWAAEGRRWKAAIRERKAYVYGPDGLPTGDWHPMLGESHRLVSAEDPTLEAVRRFWDAHPLYSGESSHAPGEKSFFEDHERTTLAEHSDALDPIFMRDVTGDRDILDVGCGIGFWVHQFSRTGARISACDLSETAVTLTRRRLELFGLTASVRKANAERLPYPDASFDHVNCQGVIHHTPDTAQCIEEFGRILRPGGTLCFSVYYKALPLRSRPLFWIVTRAARPWMRLRGRGREGLLSAKTPEELVRLYDGSDNPIGKAFSLAELETMLAGRFRILEHRRFGFPRRALPFAVPSRVHRVLSRMLGLMIAVRCQKIESTPTEFNRNFRMVEVEHATSA